MRCFILAFALTVTACAQEEPAAPPGLVAGTYAGGGRDALCIAGQAGTQRAGFVVYGADNANCSASGRTEPVGAGWTLIPAGDAECKIPLTVTAGQISLGSGTPACAYYCGPGASFAGKSFTRSSSTQRTTDLAGDPLC